MLRAGYDLGATGRLALMAKLAEGTGMKVRFSLQIHHLLTLFLSTAGIYILAMQPPTVGYLVGSVVFYPF